MHIATDCEKQVTCTGSVLDPNKKVTGRISLFLYPFKITSIKCTLMQITLAHPKNLGYLG